MNRGVERKLTQLLNTNNEFMTFGSYYLKFLIDTCHLVIDDVKEIAVFHKTDCFNSFVTTYMGRRIEAIKERNNGKSLYCKMMLNSSYGFDGLNEENYSKTKFCTLSQARMEQGKTNFLSTRQINDDLYMVSYKPMFYKCNTCIQESFFTLDNAKYAYVNFVYNFMHKCLDMSKIHFIEGDTDSSYWAISGDSEEDIHQ
jgi:hypothetical protein